MSTQSIDIENIELVIRSVVENFKGQNFDPEKISPYYAVLIYNVIAKELNLPEMRTQMGYNYARNGMIVKGVKDRLNFTTEEIVNWLVKFVAKKILSI